MGRKTPPQYISFDELAADATVEVTQRRRGVAGHSAVLLAAAAVVGVAVSCLFAPVALGASAAVSTVKTIWDELPSELPIEQTLPQHTILLDKDGVEFARLFSENRFDVPLEQISSNFTEALIATENSRFYEQGGVDVQGIARAALSNILGGETQGASTITQQLVQNILITNARTDAEREVAIGTSVTSKLREVKYAVELDKKLTKDEILTMYSNAVFFGNGSYGVEAAAHTYFSKPAADLTVGEGALLAGLLKAPNIFDPMVNPEGAVERRNVVISRMETENYLTAAEADTAAAGPLTLTPGVIASGCAVSAYPYYCAVVRDELLSNEAFGSTVEERAENLRRGGLTFTTALNRSVTDGAQAAANDALTLENRAAAGIAVVVPGTGHIAAVAQNRVWGQTEIVYATSRFQTGSAFKPIVTATALEQGVPVTHRFKSSGPYISPTLEEPAGGFNNSGKAQYGSIDMKAATRMSVNIYFIKLIEKTGVLPVADMAHRLGITSIPTNLSGAEASLALGTYESTPLEMANAYATFIGGGVSCNPVSVLHAVRTSTGEPVAVSDPACRQEISPTVAATVADTLRGAFEPGGTLTSVGALPGRDTAAKTGTTDSSAAVWTVGMTPQYATAVWVGDPLGGFQNPMKNVVAYGRNIGTVYGASIPGPIWKQTMAHAHLGLPAVAFPAPGEAAIGSTTARAVPDVRGMSSARAAAAITAAGLSFVLAEATTGSDGTTAPNHVVSQTPRPGTVLSGSETLTLTLSHGSDTDASAK